jgi:glucose-1-phosphate thymidylyltransferase
MKAIIPVAGEGVRLRPHTHTTPKPLLSVAGKPIIAHIIDQLLQVGVDELELIIGHLGDKIRDFIEKEYKECKVKANFVCQDSVEGIAHAVYLTREYMDGSPVLIILGDTIFDTDLKAVVDAGRSALGVKEVEDPSRFGVVETEGQRIVRLVEKPKKPKSKLVLTGIYYIVESGQLFQAIEKLIKDNRRNQGEFQLTDALQAIIDQGVEVGTFPVKEWYDCGKPETLLDSNRRLLVRYAKTFKGGKDAIVIPPVNIHERAEITRSIVGPNVSVANGASITDSIITESIIGAEAKLECVALSNSIIGPQAEIKGAFHSLNVGDSSSVHLR